MLYTKNDFHQWVFKQVISEATKMFLLHKLKVCFTDKTINKLKYFSVSFEHISISTTQYSDPTLCFTQKTLDLSLGFIINSTHSGLLSDVSSFLLCCKNAKYFALKLAFLSITSRILQHHFNNYKSLSWIKRNDPGFWLVQARQLHLYHSS